MAKRKRWEGPIPVTSTCDVRAAWRETDDDGSVWYVAEGKGGTIVERALIEPKGARLTRLREQEREQNALEQDRRKKRERHILLRSKRSRGEALSASEQQEVLDFLMGI